LAVYGGQHATVDANVVGALGPIGFATEKSISQSLDAWGDLYLQPTLRWNNGVNNYLIYGMMNFPVGAYDPNRLVNFGLGIGPSTAAATRILTRRVAGNSRRLLA
jgi:hypothetical protein